MRGRTESAIEEDLKQTVVVILTVSDVFVVKTAWTIFGVIVVRLRSWGWLLPHLSVWPSFVFPAKFSSGRPPLDRPPH